MDRPRTGESMPGPPHQLATAPAPRRSRFRELLTRLAPRWLAVPGAGGPLAATEKQPLVAEPPSGPVASGLVSTRSSRWRVGLRRLFLGVVPFVGSAVAVAGAFRSFYGGPMLARSVFAAGSLGWLAAAGVVRLLRRRDVERRGFRAEYALAWIGLLWAALARW